MSLTELTLLTRKFVISIGDNGDGRLSRLIPTDYNWDVDTGRLGSFVESRFHP